MKRPEAPRPTAQRWVSPPRVAQRPSYDQNPGAMEAVPLPDEPGTPIHKHVGPVVEGPEVMEPGTTNFEAIPPGSVFAGNSGGPQQCGCGGGGCGGSCGQCDEGCSDGTCDYGWEVFDGCCGPFLRGLSVFAGVDGFKGPLDRGGHNGNFGMNEGINLARPLGDPWGCGYQIGANFVQSDFSGASVVTADGLSLNAPFRKQYFATAGVFRRALCHGFQWGVAYDFLHDIYYQNANLQQIRSETGFVLDDTYEIGYYGAYGVSTDKDRVVVSDKLDATEMFLALHTPQFRERRRRPNLGRGHRRRRWAVGRRSLDPARTRVRAGKPHQLHDPQARPRRYRPNARILGIAHPVGLVSRPERQVPTEESIPPDLQRRRQLAVHGGSAGQIAGGLSPYEDLPCTRAVDRNHGPRRFLQGSKGAGPLSLTQKSGQSHVSWAGDLPWWYNCRGREPSAVSRSQEGANMSVDASTTYLGLKLKNPLVISACPLTAQIDQLRRLEEAGAAAAVLPSLFEEQIEHDAEEMIRVHEFGTDSFAEALTYFPEQQDFVTAPQEYLETIAQAKKAVRFPSSPASTARAKAVGSATPR